MNIYEAIETVLKNSRNMIGILYFKAKYSFFNFILLLKVL